jgi:iron complex outermembrane receptor protein
MGVNYNLNDEWNTYVSVSYTSREPRLRNLYAAEDAYFGATPQFKADTAGGTVRYNYDRPFGKPERLLDFELGGSYRTLTLQLTASAYWMEFTDELVKSGKIDIFGQPVTGNADLTRHIGLELEGNVVASSFTFSGNLTLSHNVLVKYRTFADQLDTAGNTFLGAINLDGNPIAGFPDFLGNLRITHTWNELTSSVLLKYVGPFYTDNFKNENNRNDAYATVDVSLMYSLPKFGGTELMVRGEIRNLLNRLYTSSGEGNAFFPAAERNCLIGLTAGF